MRFEWRVENGLRFLCIDNRGGLPVDEMLDLLEDVLSEVEAAGHGTRILLQVDPDEHLHPDFLAALKHAIRERLDPAGAKVAITGIHGIGRSMLRGLQLLSGGRGALAFPDRDSALAYLARA